MSKFINGLFAVLVCTALYAGVASAQTPLDPTGELTGFVPPSQNAIGCDRYVNKRVTLFPLNCAIKCTVAKATALSKNVSFDGTLCETTASYSCKAQYDRAMVKLDQGRCLGCLNTTVQAALYPSYRDVIRATNAQIYCDANNSVPLDDGSGGFVSLNKDITKCQNKVARTVFKLTKCLNLHCHQKTAEALYWGRPANNAGCEDEDALKSCKAKYLKSTGNLVGCPACLGATQRAAIFDSVQAALASRNGDIYCAD